MVFVLAATFIMWREVGKEEVDAGSRKGRGRSWE